MPEQRKPVSNFVCLLLVVVSLCVSTITNGQVVTTSPYSSYGIGEQYFSSLNYNTGLGFGGAALDSNLHVNILNPAAMSGLMYSTFEGSVATRQGYYKDQFAKSFKWNTTLDHLVIGLPVAKKTGLSFGLMPFSGVGTNQTDTVDQPGFGRINYLNSDSGGVNKAFLAVGTGIKKFSIGVEGSYLFGHIRRQRDVVVLDDPSALGVSRISYTRISGFSLRAGVHYKTKIKTGYKDTIPDSVMSFGQKISRSINGTKLAFSATYTPGTTLFGESTMWTNTFKQLSTGRSNYLNVEYVPEVPGSFYIPQTGSVGVALFKGKWTTVADFEYRKGSEFRTFEPRDTVLENGEAQFSGSDSLINSWKVSAGVQFHPDASKDNFFMQGKYRLGAYYKNTGLHVNGLDIMEYGATLGWGIPIKRSYANGPIPAVEIAVCFGERGTLDNNNTRERFITARVGMTINDRWFVRRKFD